MSETFELQAQSRSVIGRGASRRLRRLENKVPAVVYGAEKAPLSLTLCHNDVFHALENEAFYSHILTLHIDGKAEKVVLKALQRHPYKPRILHMDFLRVSEKSKLRMHVPLHFIGEDKAPGVKSAGLVNHYMSDVEVSCLPANLPEFIEIDVSALELNQTLHLSDIKLPKGVELVAHVEAGSEQDHPVVSIHLPRVVEEEVIPTEAPVAPSQVPATKVKAEDDAAASKKDDKK